jgi:hypothetical protein
MCTQVVTITSGRINRSIKSWRGRRALVNKCGKASLPLLAVIGAPPLQVPVPEGSLLGDDEALCCGTARVQATSLGTATSCCPCRLLGGFSFLLLVPYPFFKPRGFSFVSFPLLVDEPPLLIHPPISCPFAGRPYRSAL